uniref:Uncharacterized protein n=1 Tax=Heterorhabditis bacteriophora TaxID=37862 RepID=A0A1I7WVQ7_HETBA
MRYVVLQRASLVSMVRSGAIDNRKAQWPRSADRQTIPPLGLQPARRQPAAQDLYTYIYIYISLTSIYNYTFTLLQILSIRPSRPPMQIRLAQGPLERSHEKIKDKRQQFKYAILLHAESGSDEPEDQLDIPTTKVLKPDRKAIQTTRRNRPERVATPEEILDIDFGPELIQKLFKDSRVGLLGEFRLVEETIHNTIGFIRDHIQSW